MENNASFITYKVIDAAAKPSIPMRPTKMNPKGPYGSKISREKESAKDFLIH